MERDAIWQGTYVVPSNTVLDRGPGLLTGREILESDWGSKHPVRNCITNCGQTVTDRGVVNIDSL